MTGRTMFRVIRSISCLSLVLWWRNGLWLYNTWQTHYSAFWL